MKLCRSCGQPLIPKPGRKYCSPECKAKQWEKKCHQCGTVFIPLEARVIFCTRSCAAKWKMTQPEIVGKMMAGKDFVAIGRAISRGLMAKPGASEKRSRLMRLRSPSMIKGSQASGIAGTMGLWGKNIPPAEAALESLFPEAARNFHIPTGKSAKLGNAQHYYLDLAWPEIKLDVEVDGYSHSHKDQKLKDAERTEFLNGLGWSVLRFSNVEVRRNLQQVKTAIESAISRLKGIQVTA